MNNETHPDATASITPEILQAVKNLQKQGYVNALCEALEEIIEFIICELQIAEIDDKKKMEYLFTLKQTEKALKPFSVEEGGKL
jgi:NTP pyrophosphatase (non-canonical NTP hydrolase)